MTTATDREGARPAPALKTPTDVLVAVATGLVAAGTAFVAGVVLLVRAVTTACPIGTTFPPGNSGLGCFAGPQVTVGVAVAALAVALGALLVLAAAAVTAARRRPLDG